MKKFLAEKIKLLISPRNQAPFPEYTALDFVKTRKGILRELLISHHAGTLIGIYSPSLGKGMFLTSVETIERDGINEIVVFDEYEASGNALTTTRVPVDEIKMVCPFPRAFRSRTARTLQQMKALA